ncbi:hypothetical protein HHI36_020239 [Cryptolaemus montrouzieri]|uniref:Uncharacterized protein n=1 Tax=Cryptolaemus montrouzieri TaxID=559131 RepID=A0ABD2NAW7_9CUCU
MFTVQGRDTLVRVGDDGGGAGHARPSASNCGTLGEPGGFSSQNQNSKTLLDTALDKKKANQNTEVTEFEDTARSKKTHADSNTSSKKQLPNVEHIKCNLQTCRKFEAN